MRLKLSGMRPAKRPYRPDRDSGHPDGTIALGPLVRAQSEDRVRMRALRNTKGLGPDLTAKARALLARFEAAREAGESPDSLASAERFRTAIIPPVGQAWKLIEEWGPEDTALVTLRPRNLLVEGEGLWGVHPKRLKKQLQNWLGRSGVSRSPGFILAGLDLEFDAERGRAGVWDPHWHCIVGGDKIAAIDSALRAYPAFDNARVDPLEQGMKVGARIKIQQGLVHLPTPILYCLKGWACHRPTSWGSDGLLHRSPIKSRVPSPYFVHWMLWLDQWILDDLVMLQGLKATKKGFQMVLSSE